MDEIPPDRDDPPTMFSTQLLVITVAVALLILPHSLGCAAERKVEFIAHRGESYDAPENTLAAINLGWQRGADGVEMDLHLTADGKLITIHDKDTLRVTGGKDKGGTRLVVLEHTADELRKLDVGKWKSVSNTGERMPLIEEVLATLPDDETRRLFIEVKVGPDAAAPLVAAIKANGRPVEQTAVISFNLETCREVERLMPELEVYYLSHFKPNNKTNAPPPTIDELIAAAQDAKLDGLDLSHEGPLDAEGVKRIHDAGLKCYVWTIDDPAIAKRMVKAGVDGITTNRAQWLREQLGMAQ
jgi:glycerophosphoryl diester phosphodiesterase